MYIRCFIIISSCFDDRINNSSWNVRDKDVTTLKTKAHSLLMLERYNLIGILRAKIFL